MDEASVPQVSSAADKAKAYVGKVVSAARGKPRMVGLMVVVVIVVAVALYMSKKDGFTQPWRSVDYKLRNKNHTDKARRSDSKNDNWNAKDFMRSVKQFNRMAAMTA